MRLQKKLFVTVLSLFIFSLVVLPSADSKTKAYYSGDAINYNNRIVFASTNMGRVDLFQMEGSSIEQKASFAPKFTGWPKTDGFNDVLFNIEHGRLIMYLIDGASLYVYDASNTSAPVLIEKKKNKVWNWYIGLTKVGDNIATIGIKSINVYNKDRMIVNSFRVTNQEAGNISFSPNANYIFNIKDNKLEIFDTNTRQVISDIDIYSKEDHSRAIFNEQGKIFVTDDSSLRVFNFSGTELKHFTHISNFGYDVVASNNSAYVYFSDGVGVVKAERDTLKPVDWAYTTDLGETGGWAMGLKIVPDPEGEKVIVFNNSAILVLDENLNLIDHVKSTDINEDPIEEMWLRTDKNRAAPDSYISLRGGGFGLSENLNISFAGEKWTSRTDSDGRFTKVIMVPSVLPTRTDIKVDGESSGLTYSTSFEIE